LKWNLTFLFFGGNKIFFFLPADNFAPSRSVQFDPGVVELEAEALTAFLFEPRGRSQRRAHLLGCPDELAEKE